MKKFFNLANGIFFLSLFSVIFLTLNLQSGKMGVVIFRNLHLPVDASIFSSRLSDIHMSRFASVARYSALILRSNHIDYNK